jgi:hypothetical protein
MRRRKNLVGVIIPYFGTLPDMFRYWLKSATNNPEIDFHLVGDCLNLSDIPKNVFTHTLAFHELNNAIGEKLGGRPLTSPYKLCDLKPTYSILFPEIVKGYKIWGFSDLDLVLGDISSLVDFKNLPRNWGRVFDFGHLSFFPNDPASNHAFEDSIAGGDTWPFIRDSRLVWIFDEHYRQGLGGVNARLEQAGYIVVGMRDRFTDVMPWYHGFFDREQGPQRNMFFMWSEGKLWRFLRRDGTLCKEETSYVHLQKRDFHLHEADDDLVFLTPRHWGPISRVDEGVRLLDVNFENDRRPLFPQRLPLAQRVRKWAYFGREVLSVNGGYEALTVLVKTSFIHGRRQP